MTYLGEKRLANFRNRSTSHKRKNSERYKDRPGMSEAHLALIRQLPCCITGKRPGGEVHHLKDGTGERGMGLRSTDKWGVPLCHHVHMDVEAAGTRNERAWFLARGIDPIVLAKDLWGASGDLEKMIKIVESHMRANGGRPVK